MQDDKNDTTEYIKGFNEGYLITQHLPDLSDKLATIESEAPRIDGFKDGRKEFVLEQLKSNRAKWVNAERSHGTPNEASKSQRKDLDRD